MKKFLTIICITIIININTVLATDTPFTDVDNHWAKDNITRMYVNGKINGYPDNTFKPNNEITIVEFIKMLFDNLNIKLEKKGLRKWPDYYIATANTYNLNYDFNKKITRYEVVEIISKVLDLSNVQASKNKFKDVSSKEKTNISKLYTLKIIDGYSDNTFRGENNLTRAEATTIILRCLDIYNQIISEKEYEINSKYTNIDRNAFLGSEIDKIRYEIKNNRIYFYDNGRFSNLRNYSIKEKYITNGEIINIIEKLISENSYTAVYYIPSEYFPNQIKIQYGENENFVSKNMEYFSLVLYENELYNLSEMTMNEEFSENCFSKITIKKMWKEVYKYQKKQYIDENVKNKLYEATEELFYDDTDEIMEYILEKYKDSLEKNAEIAEQIQIGKYIVNTYKKDDTSLEFYFEKL